MAVGAGIRPVIEMKKEAIKYNIYTKTDGNGTIEVVDSAFGGDPIQFKVTAKKGLKVVGLTITTDSGEKVEFKEEDIRVDSTGVYSISTNKFTMPYENVTIEAKWSIINPSTGSKALMMGLFLIIILGIGTYFYRRKESR